MSDDPQKTRDDDAAKSRKGLSLSINLNSVLTTIVGFLVLACLNEMKTTHDAVITLQSQYREVSNEVQHIENYLGWNDTHRRIPNGQVPTQDN